MMNSYVTGLTIKALREDRNMTQAELAAQIGVSSKTVSKWENNMATPELDKLIGMKKIFDVSLDELAGCIADDSLWETLDAKALGQAIDRFLDTQSKDSRVIFLRRYWFYDSIEQIAAGFGATESWVKSRLLRTRSKLRIYLIEEGYIYE